MEEVAEYPDSFEEIFNNFTDKIDSYAEEVRSNFLSKLNDDLNSAIVLRSLKEDYDSIKIFPFAVDLEKFYDKNFITHGLDDAPRSFGEDKEKSDKLLNLIKLKISKYLKDSQYFKNIKEYDLSDFKEICLIDFDIKGYFKSWSVIYPNDIGDKYFDSIDQIIRIKKFDNMPEIYFPNSGNRKFSLVKDIDNSYRVSLSEDSRDRILKNTIKYYGSEDEKASFMIKMNMIFNQIKDEKNKTRIFKNIQAFDQNLKLLIKDFITTEERYLTSDKNSLYDLYKFEEYKSLLFSRNTSDYSFLETSEKGAGGLLGVMKKRNRGGEDFFADLITSDKILQKINNLKFRDYIYIFVLSSSKEYNNKQKIAKFIQDTFFKKTIEKIQFDKLDIRNLSYHTRYHEIISTFDFAVSLRGTKLEKIDKLSRLTNLLHSQAPRSVGLDFKTEYNLEEDDIKEFIFGEEDIEYLKNSKYLNKYNINITQEAVGCYFNYLMFLNNQYKYKYNFKSKKDMKISKKDFEIQLMKNLISIGFTVLGKEDACLIFGLDESAEDIEIPFKPKSVKTPYRQRMVCRDISELNDIDFINIYEKIFNSLESFLKFLKIDYSNLNSDSTIKTTQIIRKTNYLLASVERSDGILNFSEDVAGPKKKELFAFNFSFDLEDEDIKGFEFKTLKDLDPYHFQVGADTDCCQVVGSEGENAAIDSYVNKYAGVLILTKNGALVSQSYFHWVPEENYLILDNVEISSFRLPERIREKCYSVLADYCIKNKFFNRVLCGMKYNKINNEAFEVTTDTHTPRIFEWNKYSDYTNGRSIDLYRPLFPTPKYTLGEKTQERLKGRVVESINPMDIVVEFKNKFEIFKKESSSSKIQISKLKQKNILYLRKIEDYKDGKIISPEFMKDLEEKGLSKKSIDQFFIKSINSEINKNNLVIKQREERIATSSEIKTKLLLEVKNSSEEGSKALLENIKEFLQEKIDKAERHIQGLEEAIAGLYARLGDPSLEADDDYSEAIIDDIKEGIRVESEEKKLQSEIASVCMEELEFINNIIKKSSLYPEEKIIKLCRYLLFNNKQSGLDLIKIAFKI